MKQLLQKALDELEQFCDGSDVMDELRAAIAQRETQTATGHATLWQLGFQEGVASNLAVADKAIKAYRDEVAAHKETNRLMTQALMQAESTIAQPNKAYAQAKDLAKWLVKKHYASDADKWEACESTAGVISQIDNMVCGLVKPIAQPESEPNQSRPCKIGGPCVPSDTSTCACRDLPNPKLPSQPKSEHQCKFPTCQNAEYQAALAEQITRELYTGQPESEPACYIRKGQLDWLRTTRGDESTTVQFANGFTSWVPEHVRSDFIPLYAAPVQPVAYVPLTEEFLVKLADSCTPNTENGSLNYEQFARAIERAVRGAP